MAKLGSKQHLVASLNVMVASKNGTDAENALNKDEIANILMAMSEVESRHQGKQTNKGRWHSGFGRSS